MDLFLADWVKRGVKGRTSPEASAEGFQGFPADAYQFLADLKANNTKEWMRANLTRYQDHVKEPLRQLVVLVGDPMVWHLRWIVMAPQQGAGLADGPGVQAEPGAYVPVGGQLAARCQFSVGPRVPDPHTGFD